MEELKNFYDKLISAMPMMMSKRYYDQICSRLTNFRGLKATDYDDDENTVIMKPLPIMDVDKLKDTFEESFGTTGNFNTGKTFQYGGCVIDLAPEVTRDADGNDIYANAQYSGLSVEKYPMKFTGNINANVGDEYKTKKIFLSRIDAISGEKFDTFAMGSHQDDYDLVTDLQKRKYRDAESIVDGAVDDCANVTLGNGGSY